MHFDTNDFSRHFARTPLVLATLLLAACGGKSSNSTNGTGGMGGDSSKSSASGTGGDDGGSGTTAMKACADEAAALCALRDMCSSSFDIERTYGSTSVCESRNAQVCVGALGAKGQGSTEATVEACADAYPDEKCADLYDDNPVADCQPPAGMVAKGAPCGDSGQCASGYCAIPPLQVCGTCQNPPMAGEPCLTTADCGRDLACVTPAGAKAGKCVALVASGGSCLSGVAPCQAGLVCVGDNAKNMTMGTCQASGATVGAACDVLTAKAPNCDANKGLVCIPGAKGSTMGTCQNIQLVAAGATCGIIGSMPATGFAACEGGGLCKKAKATDPTGTCVAPAADGAVCDNNPLNGPPCLAPAKCVPAAGSKTTAGTCVVPNASTCM